MVYDLGGGTFDVSVLTIDGAVVQVVIYFCTKVTVEFRHVGRYVTYLLRHEHWHVDMHNSRYSRVMAYYKFLYMNFNRNDI